MAKVQLLFLSGFGALQELVTESVRVISQDTQSSLSILRQRETDGNMKFMQLKKRGGRHDGGRQLISAALECCYMYD